MSRYIDAEKMIADTEAMRAVSEAITIDGIIKYINEHATTNETAIKALEKQIPKKPKIDRVTFLGDFDELRCPICNNCLVQRTELGDYFEGSKCAYCEDCGQAIDWSDEK